MSSATSHETRINVKLSGPLAEHAHWRMETSDYSTPDEYILDLVRRDMDDDSETEKMRRAFAQSYSELAAGNYRVISEDALFAQALKELEEEGFEIRE